MQLHRDMDLTTGFKVQLNERYGYCEKRSVWYLEIRWASNSKIELGPGHTTKTANPKGIAS